MRPLLCPKLLARIDLLNELLQAGEIRGNRKALELITSHWVLHHTLWSVHYRVVIMSRAASQPRLP